MRSAGGDDHPSEDLSTGALPERVVKGFLATSAGTLLVALGQLLYGSVTARLLDPSAFGAYAVALSGAGVFGLLSGASLGDAAARRGSDDAERDRELLGAAFLWGSVGACAMVLAAPLWSSLWGVPEATAPTRVLAAVVPLASITAVLAGVLRRMGSTVQVARSVAAGVLLGMLISLPVIAWIREGWVLALNPVLGALFGLALLSRVVPRDRRVPNRPRRATAEDLLYGVKGAALSFCRYGLNTVAVWSIGRFVGADALGLFNRAIAVLTVPIESLQRALTYTLFPELRPNAPAALGREAFTALMVALTWITVLVSGLGYFAAAPLLSLLLGSAWSAAAPIAGLALLLGSIPIVVAPLGARLEALGSFRPAFAAIAAQVIAIAVGSTVTFATQSLAPAMIGMLAGGLASWLLFIAANARSDGLDPASYLRLISPVLGLQAISTAVLVGLDLGSREPVLALLMTLGVGVVELIVLWLLVRGTEPAQWLARHVNRLRQRQTH